MDILKAIKANNLKKCILAAESTIFSEDEQINCLKEIAIYNRFKILEYFIDNGIINVLDFNNEFYIPDNGESICLAIKHGSIAVIKVLLKYNPCYALFEGNKPFNFACKMNNIRVVKLFLENKKLDVTINNNFSLRYSTFHSSIDVVKLLLSFEKSNPSDFNNEAIREAYQKENLELTYLLWEQQKVKDTLQKSDQILYNFLITQDVQDKLENF
jgi:ankyrin repeat protein